MHQHENTPALAWAPPVGSPLKPQWKAPPHCGHVASSLVMEALVLLLRLVALDIGWDGS